MKTRFLGPVVSTTERFHALYLRGYIHTCVAVHDLVKCLERWPVTVHGQLLCILCSVVIDDMESQKVISEQSVLQTVSQ